MAGFPDVKIPLTPVEEESNESSPQKTPSMRSIVKKKILITQFEQMIEETSYDTARTQKHMSV